MSEEPTPGPWLEALRALSKQIHTEDYLDSAVEVLAAQAALSVEAEGSLVFLPSLGETWVCEGEFFVNEKLPSVLGLPFGNPNAALGDEFGSGLAVATTGPDDRPFEEEQVWARRLGIKGPALYVPILIDGTTAGCLTLWRDEDASTFQANDGLQATAFAAQAALAVQLTEGFETRLAAQLEEERSRIARDLHDLAIQDLFATGMRLQTMRRKLRESPPHAKQTTHLGMSRSTLDGEVVDSLAALERSVAQIRRIVYGLRGEEQPIGLIDRLRNEASMGRGHLGFAPTFVIEVDQGPASPAEVNERVGEDLADDVVAVMREALSNVARHASANSVQVGVDIYGKGRSGEIVLSILDDGHGLDPDRDRHSGLANMQRRATLRGGTFGVGAGPKGRGTSLIWRAPLE